MRFLPSVGVLAVLLPVAASAVPIFSEDFEAATGSSLLQGDADFHSTEREGGFYYSGVSLPGWTLTNSADIYVHEGLSGNTAVLLNEGLNVSISQLITGLAAGVQHTVMFNFWGDNTESGRDMVFDVTLGGQTAGFNLTGQQGLRTGRVYTGTVLFTPSATSELLRFRVNGAGDGVLLDNIALSNALPPPPTSVPEPSTLCLLGAALAGFGIGRRRKATEATH